MSITFSPIRIIPKTLRKNLCNQNPEIEVNSGSRHITKNKFSFEVQKGTHQNDDISSMMLSGEYYRILAFQSDSSEPVARLDYRLTKNIGSPKIKSIVIDKIHNGATICGRDGIGVEEEIFNLYEGLRTSMLHIALTHAITGKYRKLLVQGATDESQAFFDGLPFPMAITRDYHDKDAPPNMEGHISFRNFPKIEVSPRSFESDSPQLEFEF